MPPPPMELLITVFRTLLTEAVDVAAAVAAFCAAWGGFLLMTASGSPHQMERGKDAIRNAAIGFGIVLTAKFFADLVMAVMKNISGWSGT